MADKPNVLSIENFNQGGLSDSKFSGVPYSLYRLTGWDLHSTPGILKVAQKLTKDSGSTIDEFVKVMVVSTNGRTYFFSSTSGKIWERDTSGTYTLVHTTTPAAGNAGCLGAIEYRGKIYWFTQSRVHRIVAADAEGAAEWAANAAEDWQTFSITDSQYHPAIIQNQDLYIGDGNYLALVDTTETWVPDALDISTPYRIKCLGKIGTDVLIGTIVDDNVNKSQIYRWNTYSVSFTTSDEIDEVGINAFIPGDNVVYINAGTRGNIYVYDGEQLQLFMKVPGEYSATDFGRVHPNAAANFNGRILLGFSKYYV